MCSCVQSKVPVYVAKCSYICHGRRTGCHGFDYSLQRSKTKRRKRSKTSLFLAADHNVETYLIVKLFIINIFVVVVIIVTSKNYYSAMIK